MYEVVVGIDFGTSGTGYAFSYKNPNDIILGKFPDQGVDMKVPTQIILDSKLEKVLAFGGKCKEYIDDNQLNDGELYFKSIKMNLYHNKTTLMPENSSTSYQLIEVIAKILEYVKGIAFSTIHKSKPKITENQIKWVVTVPAIWDYSQKGLMVQACEKAGLFNENTTRVNCFALEAEAASLYCSQDETIDLDYIKNGKSYILCDLGGGTGDIITHKKELNGKVTEIYPSIGGDYGSEEIDKQIYDKVIYKIFGFKNYSDLKKRNEEIGSPCNEDILFTEWMNLNEEIQKKKKLSKDSINKTFSLNCQLFEHFTNNISLQDLVDKYNSECPKSWEIQIKTKWWLNIPYIIFFDLINEHAKKISNLLSKIYQKVSNIESIIYVGGYSSNEILISKIKSDFENLVHLNPSRPIIAVVKGAVLFGLNPEIINIRKAPYTIGFNSDHIWDDNIHGGIGQKYYDYIFNIFKCQNCFDKFIEIGQDLYLGQTITRDFIAMNPRYIILKFFKTKKANPILYTEDNVELLGQDYLDLGRDYPINERDFKVIMEFGGTYVEAKCIHNKSQIEKNIKLYFNKNNNLNIL